MCQKLTNLLGEWAVLLRHPNRIHKLDIEQIRRGQALLDARQEKEDLGHPNKSERSLLVNSVISADKPSVSKQAQTGSDDYLEYTTEPWFGGAMTEKPAYTYEGGSL